MRNGTEAGAVRNGKRITRAMLFRLVNRVLEVPGCKVPHGAGEAIEECGDCNEVVDVLVGDLSDMGIVVVNERGK